MQNNDLLFEKYLQIYFETSSKNSEPVKVAEFLGLAGYGAYTLDGFIFKLDPPYRTPDDKFLPKIVVLYFKDRDTIVFSRGITAKGTPVDIFAIEKIEPFELHDAITEKLKSMGYTIKDNEKNEFKEYSNSYKERSSDTTKWPDMAKEPKSPPDEEDHYGVYYGRRNQIVDPDYVLPWASKSK